MLRVPEEVLRSRYARFQEGIKALGLDAAVIRTLSTFIYLAGVRWLRPALIIPAEGEPLAFVARGEEEGFKEMTWIKNVETFVEGGELMSKVSSYLKGMKAKKVGMEFGVERDAYIFFFETFKRLNRGVEVVDVSELIDSLRIVKDSFEKQFLREAGLKAKTAFEKALNSIKPGVSETEIAAEVYSTLYRMGSEEPLVYVNAGPHPRVHSEPLSTVKVVEGTTVTVVISADHYRYYVNKSASIPVGSLGETGTKALRCMEEAFEIAVEQTKVGVRFIDVMKKLDEIYTKYGMLEHRVVGYVHSVGLKAEETPITTIVPKHRSMSIKPSMSLAMVHAPILLPGVGQVKKEETFMVNEDGGLTQIT